MSSSPFFIEGSIPMGKLNVATNDELLEAWRVAVKKRYRGKTIASYTEAASRYVEFLNERGLTMATATPQLLCDYLCALAAKCKNLGRIGQRYHCRAHAFTPTTSLPDVCGLTCAAYEQGKVESYLATEKGLARFHEFAARETNTMSTDPFPEVRARIRDTLKKRRLREREDARYPRRALTDAEIAALFRTSWHPRDRLVLALMIKTGVRHQEALQLPDGPDVRGEWRDERIITVTTQHGIKRLGNPYLIIDDQLWRVLENYFTWKAHATRTAPPEDARHARLLLSKRGDRTLGTDGMASLWRTAGERAGIKISPIQDAPLTPHSARYTFCRLLEEAGFTPFWIARLRDDVQAPDAALKSAWTYAKRAPSELRNEYIKRFPTLPT
jgi:site-specific recombinase XerD